jgi:hypothetical protein
MNELEATWTNKKRCEYGEEIETNAGKKEEN